MEELEGVVIEVKGGNPYTTNLPTLIPIISVIKSKDPLDRMDRIMLICLNLMISFFASGYFKVNLFFIFPLKKNLAYENAKYIFLFF